MEKHAIPMNEIAVLRARGDESSLPTLAQIRSDDLIDDLRHCTKGLALAVRGIKNLRDEGFEPGADEFEAIRIMADDVAVRAAEVARRQQ